MRPAGRAFLLLTAALLSGLARTPAAAQGGPPEPFSAEASARRRRLRDYFLAPDGAGARGPCLWLGRETRRRTGFDCPLFVKSRPPGKLTRLTLLAGMFMGRVPVFCIGAVSVRFNLEIR